FTEIRCCPWCGKEEGPRVLPRRPIVLSSRRADRAQRMRRNCNASDLLGPHALQRRVCAGAQGNPLTPPGAIGSRLGFVGCPWVSSSGRPPPPCDQPRRAPFWGPRGHFPRVFPVGENSPRRGMPFPVLSCRNSLHRFISLHADRVPCNEMKRIFPLLGPGSA